MLAGVLVVAMAGGSFAAGYVQGAGQQAITAEAAEKSELEEKIGELVNKKSGVDDTTKDHIVEDKLYIDVVPVWKWLLTDFV